MSTQYAKPQVEEGVYFQHISNIRVPPSITRTVLPDLVRAISKSVGRRPGERLPVEMCGCFDLWMGNVSNAFLARLGNPLYT